MMMRKVRLKRLWDLAERMDWYERWPAPFWEWLLHRLDRLNGHFGMPRTNDRWRYNPPKTTRKGLP